MRHKTAFVAKRRFGQVRVEVSIPVRGFRLERHRQCFVGNLTNLLVLRVGSCLSPFFFPAVFLGAQVMPVGPISLDTMSAEVGSFPSEFRDGILVAGCPWRAFSVFFSRWS